MPGSMEPKELLLQHITPFFLTFDVFLSPPASFFCGEKEPFKIETGQKSFLIALSGYTWGEKELIKEKKVMLCHALYLYGMMF